MTKPQSETTLASIILKLGESSENLGPMKVQILHDVKAASLSYSMLIEEVADQLIASGSERALKKIDQLRKHEAINKIVTEMVIRAIENEGQ